MPAKQKLHHPAAPPTHTLNQPNPRIFQQAVDYLTIEGERVRGFARTGIRLHAQAIALTARTFLGGRIHVGLDRHACGRAAEHPRQVCCWMTHTNEHPRYHP